MTYCGKNEVVLKQFADNTYDACVTDAPYGLGEEPDAIEMIRAWVNEGYMPIQGRGFMRTEWDAFVPQPNFWKEIYRVLKPGAFVVCFFGTRTYDWGVLAMRLAGFEIRDQLAWIYGEGFPKGIDIGKQVGGKNFQGWKTGLKPAYEPIVLARKPIDQKTITKNMIKHGVGAYNIDATRVGSEKRFNQHTAVGGSAFVAKQHEEYEGNEVFGRYPTNVLLGHHEECEFIGFDKIKVGMQNSEANMDVSISEISIVTPRKSGVHYGEEVVERYNCHQDCPIRILDEQSGTLVSGSMKADYNIGENGVLKNYGILGDRKAVAQNITGSSGGASRFFYCSKATSDEREIGVKSWKKNISPNNISGGTETRMDGKPVPKRANNHPTVKPVDIMRYLCKLITPKGGKIIEPFGGSGTTAVAAKMEFMECDIIEQDEYWCKIIDARVAAWKPQYSIMDLFK